MPLSTTFQPIVNTPATGTSLMFPADLETYPFFMTLSFYKYQVPPFFTGNAGTATLTALAYINLPLPNYMVDNQMVVYDQEALGLALGAGLNAAASSGNAGEAVVNGIGGFAAGAAGQGLLNLGARAAGALNTNAGTAGGAIGQAIGFTVNPFMTVMFKTPAFKKHSLSWKLSPKNETESKTVNLIVNTLRQHQLPNVALSAALLSYPDVVYVEVSNLDPANYFSYMFKPAVIEACAVNYTPAGQPSFFNVTNAPGEVEISLSLLEIEMWLQTDYGVASSSGLNATVNNALSAVGG